MKIGQIALYLTEFYKITKITKRTVHLQKIADSYGQKEVLGISVLLYNSDLYKLSIVDGLFLSNIIKQYEDKIKIYWPFVEENKKLI